MRLLRANCVRDLREDLGKRSAVRMVVDHEEPVRKSGKSYAFSNSVPACWSCNHLTGELPRFAFEEELTRAVMAKAHFELVSVLGDRKEDLRNPQWKRPTFLEARAYALMGRVAAGTALLEEAVTLSESINLQVAESSSLVLLGEAHLLAGRVDDAHVAGTRALAMARRRGQRGDEASALHLLGDIATHLDPVDVEGVRQLQAATGLAEELSLRPLVAHCHLGLGTLYRRTGKREEAREHFTAATTMYRDMDMPFYLQQVEAEIRELTE